MATKQAAQITGVVISTGIAVVGGYGGTKLTTAVEVGMAKKGNKNAGIIAPAITEAIGLVGQIFSPNPMLRDAFLGMSVVAGTELLEKVEQSMSKVQPPPTTTVATTETQPANVSGQTRVGAFENVNGGQTRVPAFQGYSGYGY